MSNWEVQELRFTAFHFSGEINIEDLWVNLIGAEPDSIQQKPKERITFAQFEMEKYIINVEFNVRSISIRIIPSIPNELPTLNPTLGNFTEDIIQDLIIITEKYFLLDGIPEIGRLAFGAILTLNVESKNEGYSKISEYLDKVELDSNNMSDFVYQINRPKFFNIDDYSIEINRLTNWSLARFNQQTLNFNKSGINSSKTIASNYFARLSLDINTTGENTIAIPSEYLNNIFEQFVKYGIEISIKGI